MNTMLYVVPYFLAARVTVDIPTGCWPEYTFLVQVNSTAIVEESYDSIHLNIVSKLVCQPWGYQVLSCQFRDSEAKSFISESHDPGEPGVPAGPVYRQKAYEINQDRFEIQFSSHGLESLIVNENVQPRELDMIRVIVGQLNVVSVVNGSGDTFELMENFIHGECLTLFYVNRDTVHTRRTAPCVRAGRDYVLQIRLGVTKNDRVQIRKVRNLHMCTYKLPYYFGRADSVRGSNGPVSTVTSSESHIVVTSTEFTSGSAYVIRIGEKWQGINLYENVTLRLESILPRKEYPPGVRHPERASMIIDGLLLEQFAK